MLIRRKRAGRRNPLTMDQIGWDQGPGWAAMWEEHEALDVPPGPFGFFRGRTRRQQGALLGLCADRKKHPDVLKDAALPVDVPSELASYPSREGGFTALFAPDGTYKVFKLAHPNAAGLTLTAAVLGPIDRWTFFKVDGQGLKEIWEVLHYTMANVGPPVRRDLLFFPEHWCGLKALAEKRVDSIEAHGKTITRSPTSRAYESYPTGAQRHTHDEAVEWFQQQWGGHVACP